MKGNVFATIERVLREECRVEAPLGPATRLQEDLGLDSVRMLTLAVELENHYRIVLGEDPDNPPRTLGELAALVEDRIGHA